MSDDLLKDFDILAPPKRIARIGGEEIDVSFVPARVALQFIGFSKKYDVKTLETGTAGNFDPCMIEDMLGIIEGICKRSSEKITAEWLLNNVDISVLMQFIQYVFAGIKKTDTEESTGENGKN